MCSSILSRRGFVCKQTTNHSLHIAIDFGTDGLGVAYALKNDVYIHTWSSKAYGETTKPKCIALFDSNQNLKSFGIDAKHDYINLSPKQRKTWMLFEQFKMALYETEIKKSRRSKSSINKVLTASNGVTMSSKKVFIAVFKYIYTKCMKWLKVKGTEISGKADIEWIITVPAIWNDEAKKCMKTWASLAGLKSNRIVYEADCASLSIQYFMDAELNTSAVQSRHLKPRIHQLKGNSKFKCGDKYILIDGGGMTVDIAAHQILSTDSFGVKEILPPSGNKWGSLYIDKKFTQLLIKIFGKEKMLQFKTKYPIKYMELMNNFVIAKESCFKSKNAEYHNVELPFELIDYMNSSGIDSLSNMVKKTFRRNSVKKVRLEDGYLGLNIALWQYMFDSVQNKLLCYIKQLLHKEMVDCKYIAIVGGLSCSPYFQSRIEEEFGLNSRYNLAVIIPSKPLLTVVRGAAYFGLTSNYIKSRILRYTYGVRVNLSLGTAQKVGIPSKHIFNNLVFNREKNECHIRNCFEIMAVKGEEVLTNQVKIKKSKRLNCNQKAIIKYIIYSDLKDPKVIDDGFKLSEIKLEFGNHVKDMIIHTEFHFYDTMLKVFVYPASKPQLRKEVELSYKHDD